jgi:hypothetical protein
MLNTAIFTKKGFDMGTVPQSHENRIRQMNRPQVAALLPAEPDFFSGFGHTTC